MSRLKSFLRRIKGDEKQTEKDGEDTSKIKPIEPARGWRRALAIFKLYFPLGMYQRALEWDLMESSPSSNTLETDGDFKDGKCIHIKEKPFSSRFRYFFTRTFLQTIGLSIVFTAPISLPWVFNVVIPFSIDLLPFGISDIIRELITRILAILSPLRVVVDIVMVVSNFFGTANPIFFYGSTLFFLRWLGITDINVFESFENSENQGTGSIIELLANQYQSKFALAQEIIVPLVIVVAGSISFFLMIRRARSILFEIQTKKEQSKSTEKIKRTFLGYYLDEGYSQVEYTENRITSSPKLKLLARVIKYGPIVSVVLPISLAIIFVLF